jgi:alkanesulfonate monooxygenase SsuD/methylene tetrahydromethanopterin reductase-like flavin-dependent oxidoreductase (luciferase family)
MAVHTRETADPRRATNPLFNDNRMKLGTFCTNCSGGTVASTAPGTLEITWPHVRALAQTSDRAGFEALVPVGRWKGFGGRTDFNGVSFEVYTWAAGLAEATSYSAVLATAHVPLVHPVMAAKQGTTIDHISGGRFALNVVCGWAPAEFAMFGTGVLRSHDEGYVYAEEWIELLRKLWTADAEFDFRSASFDVRGAISKPKPLQAPHPPIMSANSSEVGLRFAARHADMSFIGIRTADRSEWKPLVDSHRRLAREEFGRELQVWIHASVICRPTQREADEYFHYAAVEMGDHEGDPMRQRGRPPAANPLPRLPGWGGFPLIGPPERIVDDLLALSEAGISGCLLSWVNYDVEQQQWIAEVLPLMEQAGLRHPFTLPSDPATG